MRRGQQIANRIGAVTAWSVVSNTAPSEAEKDAADDRLYAALESDEGYALARAFNEAREIGAEQPLRESSTALLAHLDAALEHPWKVLLLARSDPSEAEEEV